MSLQVTSPFSHKDIRQSFLNFFSQKTHKTVKSASLVPQGDPTLLFNNAGMNPFKDIFLGTKQPQHPRVCNSQKCIRLSGKHNDLEEVGRDTYHHAFFEMLGNWSFGDYGKAEAIKWAWELLTEVWGLPKEKLYATIYKDDDEALELWTQVTDIPVERVFRFGEKDNFWEMGPVGPCGPCSEIHIDVGEENCTCQGADAQAQCRKPGGGVNRDCARYIEIWNLVFIQYNREESRELTPLAHTYIDTGMGFERITAVLQQKSSNYETDIFSPIIASLETLSGKKYPLRKMETASKDKSIHAEAMAFRVIVDHIRAISFAVGDHVLPSNEGRGYVIRRLIRRAYRYGKTLGLEKPFLHQLIPALTETMGDFYTELRDEEDRITQTLLSEEKLFDQTLHIGEKHFQTLVSSQQRKNKTAIPGELAFELYDTYGFPVDLIRVMAEEVGMTLEEAGLETAMAEQKHRSRQAGIQTKDYLRSALKDMAQEKTQYTGEEETSTPGRLLRILSNGTACEKIDPGVAAGKDIFLLFDSTPFYGEGGGQIGDQGWIEEINPKNQENAVPKNSIPQNPIAKVVDTQRIDALILLKISDLQKDLTCGETYMGRIDEDRRHAVQQNHSATHLLHQALIDTLGDHVKQRGSLVGTQRLRFDFNHPQNPDAETLRTIEATVRKMIYADLRVETAVMDKDQAFASGARAFFEEKYGETVRVVTMGTYSKEFCGGSHVPRTSAIHGFHITGLHSVASGIKRIEAVTGEAYAELTEKRFALLAQLTNLFQTGEDALLETAQKRLAEKTQLKDRERDLQTQVISDRLKASCQPVKTTGSVFHFFGALEQNQPLMSLSQALDRIKTADEQSVIVILHEDTTEKKLNFWVGVGERAQEQIQANTLIKRLSELTGGTGGGKAGFAQGGSRKIPGDTHVILETLRKEIFTSLQAKT